MENKNVTVRIVERKCGNCTHMNINRECRRYPPKPVVDRFRVFLDETRILSIENIWPVMTEHDYCGEFNPHPGAIKDPD